MYRQRYVCLQLYIYWLIGCFILGIPYCKQQIDGVNGPSSSREQQLPTNVDCHQREQNGSENRIEQNRIEYNTFSVFIGIRFIVIQQNQIRQLQRVHTAALILYIILDYTFSVSKDLIICRVLLYQYIIIGSRVVNQEVLILKVFGEESLSIGRWLGYSNFPFCDGISQDEVAPE